MLHRQEMFGSFSSVTKAEWLAKIEKDLKGKPLADMYRPMGGTTPDPFAHAEDLVSGGYETMPNRPDNDWLIGEDFFQPKDGDYAAANKQLLSALMQGVNAPCLHVSSPISAADMQVWLHDVALAYVAMNFVVSTEQDPNFWLSAWANEPIVGTIYWQYATSNWVVAHHPSLLTKAVFGNSTRDESDIPAALADLLRQIDAHFKAGASATSVQHALFVEVFVGVQYFLAIAQIRALNLLMANVFKAWSLDPTVLPAIHARLLPSSQLEDTNSNMIRATTQAMSAALGGALRITLQPADTLTAAEPSDFTRSVARNVHHLLKMESYLDFVADPAHGSYYIETLTHRIAEKAWSLFVQ